MNKSLSFVFNGYESNLEKGEILFYFGLKGEKNVDFTEKISFFPVANKIPQVLLKPLLDNLMLILGISYWKLYCPREIVIENNFLIQEQAQFWNTVYTKGLGEFFYKNKIDFRGLVNFPFTLQNSDKIISFPRKNRALVGVGGGKDSIVAAEMLKAQNKDFGLFIVGTSKIQKEVAFIIGKKPIVVTRELDSKLFELNKKENVYNGHIPISAIYAFLGLIACIFYDYKSFIVGNEKSANYGNVEYLGEIINHQWSKSEEFENLFKQYVKKFVTLDVSYSSILRNMNELEVIKEFVKYPKYFKVFSSCNNNFKIQPSFAKASEGKWCGKCAKCFFVFTMLSSFLSKETVLNIFGKNLFADESLLPLFQELIGIKNFKPFECVGTPEEVKLALLKIMKRGEFKDSILVRHYQNL